MFYNGDTVREHLYKNRLSDQHISSNQTVLPKQHWFNGKVSMEVMSPTTLTSSPLMQNAKLP